MITSMIKLIQSYALFLSNAMTMGVIFSLKYKICIYAYYDSALLISACAIGIVYL